MFGSIIGRLFKSQVTGEWSTRRIGAWVRGVVGPALVALVLKYAPEMGYSGAEALISPVVDAVVGVAVSVWLVAGAFLEWRLRDDEDARRLGEK